MHAAYTGYLYQCAAELSIPFIVVILGQDAVAKQVQEEGLRWNSNVLLEPFSGSKTLFA